MPELPEPARQPLAASAPPARRAWMLGIMGVVVAAGVANHLASHDATKTAAAQQAQIPVAAPLPAQHATAQFAMISPENAAQALSKSGLPPSQQADILAGIKRRDYRLVEMPIYDSAGTGGVVAVNSGGISQTVALSATKPKVVVLPIRISGEVDIVPISNPGIAGIAPGAITVLGPTALPVIHQNESLVLNVIVQ